MTALFDLHSAGYAHLDLKPHNIVVDNTGQFSIIDYGSTRPLGSRFVVYCTFPFCPPEALFEEEIDITTSIDAFSLGATLYYAIYGTCIFPNAGDFHDDRTCVRRLYDAGLFKIPDTCPPNVPMFVFVMMRSLLQLDPAVRISIQHLYALISDDGEIRINSPISSCCSTTDTPQHNAYTSITDSMNNNVKGYPKSPLSPYILLPHFPFNPATVRNHIIDVIYNKCLREDTLFAFPLAVTYHDLYMSSVIGGKTHIGESVYAPATAYSSALPLILLAHPDPLFRFSLPCRPVRLHHRRVHPAGQGCHPARLVPCQERSDQEVRSQHP